MPAYGLLALATLAALVIYVLHAGNFFILDSVDVISTNVGLQFDASEFDRWRVAALSSDRGLFNRPLSNLSFAIDAQLAGAVDPRWMKITNILLHLVTGLLGWRLFSLALVHSPVSGLDAHRARWVAAIGLAFWLLHPIHVSTVLYTVQRMAQLSTLFVVAGLWFCMARRVRWLQSAPAATELSSTLLGMVVFMLLAMSAKGNGALLPLYAAALELGLFRGRVAGGVAVFPYRLSQLCLLVPASLVILLLFFQPAVLDEAYAGRDFGVHERALTQLRALWNYLGWMVLWDSGSMGLFHDDYRLSTSLLKPASTLVSLAAWLVLGSLAWLLRRRVPMLGFALLWYLAGHAMESTLIPLELVFEHRNYLPAMGPLLLLAWSISAVPVRRYGVATVTGSVVLVVLGTFLFARTSYWSSELTLAESQHVNHPDSMRSRLHLANVHVNLIGQQRDQQSMQEHFSAARELHWLNIRDDRNYIPSLFSLIQLESLGRQSEQVQKLYAQLAVAIARPEITPTEFSSLQQLVACLDGRTCIEPTGGTRAYLEQLLKRHDSTATREMLMRYCLASGDQACVQEHAEAALAVDEEFVYAYLALYLAGRAAGDIDGMQSTVQRMLAADPLRQQIYGIRDSAGVSP